MLHSHTYTEFWKFLSFFFLLSIRRTTGHFFSFGRWKHKHLILVILWTKNHSESDESQTRKSRKKIHKLRNPYFSPAFINAGRKRNKRKFQNFKIPEFQIFFLKKKVVAKRNVCVCLVDFYTRFDSILLALSVKFSLRSHSDISIHREGEWENEWYPHYPFDENLDLTAFFSIHIQSMFGHHNG